MHRLRLLDEMISVMNFLQSTQISMATQSSVISLGSSSSSCERASLLPCLDNLQMGKKKKLEQHFGFHRHIKRKGKLLGNASAEALSIVRGPKRVLVFLSRYRCSTCLFFSCGNGSQWINGQSRVGFGWQPHLRIHNIYTVRCQRRSRGARRSRNNHKRVFKWR